MWLFLSRRIRAWVLVSVAVPLVAGIVGSLAERARASDPASKRARLLTRVDSTLRRVARRKDGSARRR